MEWIRWYFGRYDINDERFGGYFLAFWATQFDLINKIMGKK